MQRRCGMLCVVPLVALAGCGGNARLMVDNFDEGITEERVTAVPLGYYVIPVPTLATGGRESAEKRNRLQIEFDLYAEVRNEYRSQAESAVERNEGRLRDNVITVCRGTPIEDLNDQTLTALKSHLIDTTMPLLDGVPIEQLRIVDRQTKPL